MQTGQADRWLAPLCSVPIIKRLFRGLGLRLLPGLAPGSTPGGGEIPSPASDGLEDLRAVGRAVLLVASGLAAARGWDWFHLSPLIIKER